MREARLGLTLLAFALLAVETPAAGLRFSKLFSDHAVLQRDIPVPVWGWAEPGEKVTVAFAGQTRTATAGEQGAWRVDLDPLAASSTGRKLTASTAAAELQIDDVLVGEVWLASGQANMRQGRRPAVSRPTIRYFNVAAALAPLPRDTIRRGQWHLAARDSVQPLSEVAGRFAMELQDALKVPVGVIVSARDATGITAWLNAEACKLYPGHYRAAAGAELKEQQQIVRFWEFRQGQYDRTWDTALVLAGRAGRSPTEEELKKQLQPFRNSLDTRFPWAKEHAKIYNMLRSARCSVYNGMIAPLVPYAIKGVVWYQGEWNGGFEPDQYFYRFAPLIAGWRVAWGRGAFPFLYVQLQGMEEGEKPPPDQFTGWYAGVREAQRLALQMPNTGMASVFDVCRGLHPPNREVAGQRLARWALARVYGAGDMVPSGPLYHSMTIDGSKLRIHFRHVGSGLLLRTYEEGPPAFVIREAGGDFKEAEVEIDGHDLVLSHRAMQKPVAARYAWGVPPIAVLLNKDGLPASPFATDIFCTANFSEARARDAERGEAIRRRRGRLPPLPERLPPPEVVPAVPGRTMTP